MATGMPSGATACATFAGARRFSGGTGSSIQPGRNGARALVIAIAVTGLNRPCISMKISVSGPTASPNRLYQFDGAARLGA